MRRAVLKRMAQKAVKPVLQITALVVTVTSASVAAEHFLGWDSFVVYWGLFGAIFLGLFLKGAYDWAAIDIKYEQEKLLRDIKND